MKKVRRLDNKSRRPLSIISETCSKSNLDAHGAANSQHNAFSPLESHHRVTYFAEEIIPKGTGCRHHISLSIKCARICKTTKFVQILESIGIICLYWQWCRLWSIVYRIGGTICWKDLTGSHRRHNHIWENLPEYEQTTASVSWSMYIFLSTWRKLNDRENNPDWLFEMESNNERMLRIIFECCSAWAKRCSYQWIMEKEKRNWILLDELTD
jgi:hypothetical protein